MADAEGERVVDEDVVDGVLGAGGFDQVSGFDGS